MKQGRILVVDDEAIARQNLTHVLTREGYQVDHAADAACALAMLSESPYQVLLTDLRMPGMDGLELLRQTKRSWPNTEVIMITAHANAGSAVEAMTQGAYYYVEKPFRLPDVRKIVGEALQKSILKCENASLRAALDQASKAPRILSSNPDMLAILTTADSLARTDCSILITGEAGTGRQALAQYIHEKSERAGPFITVHCDTLTEDALAHALFGQSANPSSPLAQHSQHGHVESANGGTLFLDEIASLPLALQVRILHLLQEHEFQRNGETEILKADVRVIAASRAALPPLIENGTFRQDLFFRLNVASFNLPPLRKRRGDIPLLAMHFLKNANQRMAKTVSEISPEAFDKLLAYNYPGNVRELENIIERGVAQTQNYTLNTDVLPQEILTTANPSTSDTHIKTLDCVEREHILYVLEHTGGNRALTAQLLGIDRVSLWRKLRRYQEEG